MVYEKQNRAAWRLMSSFIGAALPWMGGKVSDLLGLQRDGDMGASNPEGGGEGGGGSGAGGEGSPVVIDGADAAMASMSGLSSSSSARRTPGAAGDGSGGGVGGRGRSGASFSDKRPRGRPIAAAAAAAPPRAAGAEVSAVAAASSLSSSANRQPQNGRDGGAGGADAGGRSSSGGSSGSGSGGGGGDVPNGSHPRCTPVRRVRKRTKCSADTPSAVVAVGARLGSNSGSGSDGAAILGNSFSGGGGGGAVDRGVVSLRANGGGAGGIIGHDGGRGGRVLAGAGNAAVRSLERIGDASGSAGGGGVGPGTNAAGVGATGRRLHPSVGSSVAPPPARSASGSAVAAAGGVGFLNGGRGGDSWSASRGQAGFGGQQPGDVRSGPAGAAGGGGGGYGPTKKRRADDALYSQPPGVVAGVDSRGRALGSAAAVAVAGFPMHRREREGGTTAATSGTISRGREVSGMRGAPPPAAGRWDTGVVLTEQPNGVLGAALFRRPGMARSGVVVGDDAALFRGAPPPPVVEGGGTGRGGYPGSAASLGLVPPPTGGREASYREKSCWETRHVCPVGGEVRRERGWRRVFWVLVFFCGQ